MNTNPFTFGNPIRDPARFFGRAKEVRQIINRLLSSAHESTSVVGERRMGKTSLLNYLSHGDVMPSLGLTPDKFCLAYIDFQGLTDITPRRFWQRVLTKTSRSACHPDLAEQFGEFSTRSQFDLFDLEDLFASVADHGLNIVLLLDEFEYVTQNPNFGPDFFGGLRALAIHSNLALITATRRELVDLCHSDEIKGSPFFNIFASIELRPFAQEDADALIEGTLAGCEIVFSSKERALLSLLGGGHPLFLQMAGYYLVEGKAQSLAGEELHQYLLTEFSQQADSHFSYLWSHTSDSEKITLLSVLGLCRQKPSRKTLPNEENLARLHSQASRDLPSLTRRGFLNDVQGKFQFFSPAFEQWVSLEILAPAGQEETGASVEAFLEEGGRERLVPVKGMLPKFRKKYWPILGDILKEISFEFIAGAVMSRIF